MHALLKIYRLGDVEIDTALGCLRRGGREQYLRQQSFDVLVFLLNHHQRAVAKDELISTIWHDAAVSDNALVQCIAEIRKSLGDDPHQPRFIRTIPKLGYRFIAPVEEQILTEESVASSEASASDRSSPANGHKGEGPVAAFTAAHPAPISAATRRWSWTNRKLVIACSVALIVIASLVLMIRSRSASASRTEVTLPQVPGKKSVAVMFFDNQSGREDLNWLREGLADMLITDLARSENLSVLGRQQLHLLLDRVEYKTGDRIGLDQALDIGRRSHAQLIVLGSFAAPGEQIRIDAQLYDVATGQVVAADQLVADSSSEILTKLDLLALKLAGHMGIPRLDSGRSTSLAEVMTDNLEAYRYYSLGVEKAQAFENTEAIRLLKKAVELDPKFAMAYARIGYAYAVTDFLPDKGMSYLEKAFQLSNRLTAKDKLYITAWYFIAKADYPAAVRTFRQIIAQYPIETEAYWRLARLLYGEEQPEEAIRILKQGLAIDPEAKVLYNGLGVDYLGLHRYSDAVAAHERYVTLAPREPNAHDSLGMSYQQSGRYEEAIAEYNAALGLNPEFEPAIIHLGETYFQQGRYAEAVRQYQRYIQVTHSSLARAVGYGDIARVYLAKGDLRRAQQAADAEMRHEKTAVWNSVLIALQRGDKARAKKLSDILFEGSPYTERGARHDLRTEAYFRGYLHLKLGRGGKAITEFQQALKHLPPTSGMELYEDCLANAYLELGRYDDAIREYERVFAINPNYPLVQFHVAQAYEQKGNREKARAAYDDFLRRWASADSDLPPISAAKKDLQLSSLHKPM